MSGPDTGIESPSQKLPGGNRGARLARTPDRHHNPVILTRRAPYSDGVPINSSSAGRTTGRPAIEMRNAAHCNRVNRVGRSADPIRAGQFFWRPTGQLRRVE